MGKQNKNNCNKNMEEEKEQLNYTLILHQIRKKLRLTLMEYCIADSIYHLSNNPKNKVKGWCYASKEHIANFLGTTRATIFDNINKLIKKGLIEKESETKYLRTTQKWYDNVVIMRIKADYQDTLHTIKKLDKGLSRNFTPDYQETLHYNNNYNNINNKREELTPSEEMKLFTTSEEYFYKIVKYFVEKGLPEQAVVEELTKFKNYWMELNKTGRKQRWELQPTFQLKRRLMTWFRNCHKWTTTKGKIIYNTLN